MTKLSRLPASITGHRPRNRYPKLLAIIFFLLLAIPAVARGPKKHTPLPSTPAPDPSYVPALALANRFLFAWQAGDLETGTLLLSDPARHSQNPEKLEQFFAASSNRSYEIGRGKGHRGRYSFPVVLVSSQSGKVRRKFSEIIVVNTGKNDWAIDKLP